MTLGERFQLCRAERGLTPQEVADGCGVDCGEVTRWESDEEEPSASAIASLCLLFGVSADDLLGIPDTCGRQQSEAESGRTDDGEAREAGVSARRTFRRNNGSIPTSPRAPAIRPYDPYRQAQLVAALARVTRIPAEHLGSVIEALQAEERPVAHRPGLIPCGLVLQWGIDLRESALWDALMTKHIRPLATLASIPVDALAALVLALFRHYDDRAPCDLVSEEEAASMVGVSAGYIRQLVEWGGIASWKVDGERKVRLRDAGTLGHLRETGTLPGVGEGEADRPEG